MSTAIRPAKLHFHDVAAHFLAMSAGERFLRFGRNLSDANVVAYVETLFEPGSQVFIVVEPDQRVSGVLHLETAGVSLGVSVSPWARGRGIGALLLQLAWVFACAMEVDTLFVRNLSFNPALQRAALRLGMNVARTAEAAAPRLRGARSGKRRRLCRKDHAG